MSDALLTVLAMTLAVYLPKALPLVAIGDRLPPLVRSWLAYVAPALLAALVAPSVVAPAGTASPANPEQLGYAVGFAAAVATRRMLPSVLVGFASVVVLTVLSGTR